MYNFLIKGTVAKAFWIMLGMAFIIVSVGMAWSLAVRGFCVVSTSPKKPPHAIHQAAGAYSMEVLQPKSKDVLP